MVISPEYSGFALGLAEVRVLVEQVNRCGGNAGAGQSCKMHQSAFDVYGPINEQRSARQWAFSMSTVLDLLAVCGRAQLLDHEQPPLSRPEPEGKPHPLAAAVEDISQREIANLIA